MSLSLGNKQQKARTGACSAQRARPNIFGSPSSSTTRMISKFIPQTPLSAAKILPLTENSEVAMPIQPFILIKSKNQELFNIILYCLEPVIGLHVPLLFAATGIILAGSHSFCSQAPSTQIHGANWDTANRCSERMLWVVFIRARLSLAVRQDSSPR